MSTFTRWPRANNTRLAAEYISKAPQTLRDWRTDDRRRIARGEKPHGPKFSVINNKIVYFIEDLDDYLDQLKANNPPGHEARGVINRAAGVAL